MFQNTHYAILTAMLAPAFFLTATASLLMSANNRLARVVDRLRGLLRELDEGDLDAAQIERMDRLVDVQRRRSNLVLRGSQLLYAAISFFVGTSLSVAIDAFLNYRLGSLPTILAVLGVLALFAASLNLSLDSHMSVSALNDEMDQAHGRARAKRRGTGE